ncbi:MAG: hypothetical protein AAF577_11840 [Pseudomonadota bacterium]
MSAFTREERRQIMAPVWPVLCILGPLFLYAVLLGAMLDGLAPSDERIAAFTFTVDLPETVPRDGTKAEPPRAPMIARELSARLEYGLVLLVLTIAAIATIAYCAAAVAARQGWRAGAGMVGFAFGLALIVFSSDSGIAAEMVPGGRLASIAWLDDWFGFFAPGIQNDLRALIVNAPLGAASEALDDDAVWHALLLAGLVSAIGVAATTALVFRFAEIAMTARADDGEVEGLTERWGALRTTLLLGGVVLTLSVIGTRSFYQWPVAMLDPASAAALTPIAATGAGMWGTLFTLLLIAGALPALMALHLEIEATADGHAIGLEGRRKWREEHGLFLAPRTALSGAFAAAAPLIATPALEGLTILFG